MRGNKRTGFTLVEILVVISIIGILVSLAMVSLGTTLATTRQHQCSYKLQQLVIATANFESRKQRLPGYCEKFGEFRGGVDPSDPGSFGGNVPPHVKIGSWAVALFGSLDNRPLYEHWTDDRYPLISDGGGERRRTLDGYSSAAAVNVSILQCPSSTGSTARHGRNNFVANTGLHARAYPFTYTRRTGAPQAVDFLRSISSRNAAFTNRYAGIDPTNSARRVPVGKPIRFDDFTDGMSNTLIISENNQAQPWHLTRMTRNTNHLTNVTMVGNEMLSVYPIESRYMQGMVWHFEDPAGVAGASPVQPAHQLNGGETVHLQMQRSNMVDLARPSSLHVGGANMGFADGHVTFVTDAIDYRVLQAIMTPNTRGSDMPANEFVLTTEEI